MERINSRFEGYDCIKLGNGTMELWVIVSSGPRILGLALGGGSNLLAVLPEATDVTPSGLTYSFRGGHRLWHAPEDPERTYVPDDDPVEYDNIDNGLRLTQRREKLTGIKKSMDIILDDQENLVIIDHVLTNRGQSPVELAPWAITQLKAGGFAILPQNVSDTGLLPNRRLSLWPYTEVGSSHISLGDKYVFVHADMTAGKLKIGWANPAGWLGYWVDGTLFVKQASYVPDGDYYDYGSSGECYCDPRFLELETLGPRIALAPDESVKHQETWTLYPDVAISADEQVVMDLVDRLQIG